MKRAQRSAARAALSGTVFLAGWVAGWLAGFGSPSIENTNAASIEDGRAPRGAISVTADREPVDAVQAAAMVSGANVATVILGLDPEPPTSTVAPAAMPISKAATADPDSPETAFVRASVSTAEVPVVEAPLPEAGPRPPETRGQLASLFTADPVKEYAKPVLRPVETPNECLVAEICIDEYLWSLYERTPKIDTNKVTERIKEIVKKKGKTRSVTKIITKYVVGDFTWKDPIAAQRAGMSLKDYVIGGMDRGFKLKLYHAFRAMDNAGLMPGITSAFRDDYRQAIATGNKAASDSSYHGGSRRGGYGHGLAVDLVSLKGEIRMQRYASSQELWKWIDAHEKELGVGRPYRDRDPPHVGPIDGKEYIAKRARANGQKVGSQTKKGDGLAVQYARLETKKRRVAARHDSILTKRTKSAKSSKGSSPQRVSGTREADLR